MPTFPLPNYEPDRSPIYNPATGQHVSNNVKNVIPNADGYGPFSGCEPFSAALPAACRGAFLAVSTSAVYTLFAGTADALYKLAGTAWTDVTRASGGAYTLAAEHSWSFAQFGDQVIATNINDELQIFNLASSTDFADAAGSPPQASYVGVESGYVTLAKLSGNERRIQRSGLDNAQFWTVGERGCTYQDLPDGGAPCAIVGDETGAFIFSESKVRRLTNQPGNLVGFTLQDYDPGRGAIAPFSVVRLGQFIGFVSERGFHVLGQPSNDIGTERVDRTFLADIDTAAIDQVQGVPDPIRNMFWWRYRSNSSSSAAYSDKLIGYHITLNKWVAVEQPLEWLISAASLGYTLEELDTVLGYTSIETVPFPLDSRVWRGGRPSLAGIDTDHKLSFFEAAPLEAIIETAEFPLGGEGRRVQVNGYRPVGDVSGAYGSIGSAETLHGMLTWGPEGTQNSTGLIPLRASGRKVKLKTRIPAGEAWTHLDRLELPSEVVRQAGRR